MHVAHGAQARGASSPRSWRRSPRPSRRRPGRAGSCPASRRRQAARDGRPVRARAGDRLDERRREDERQVADRGDRRVVLGRRHPHRHAPRTRAASASTRRHGLGVRGRDDDPRPADEQVRRSAPEAGRSRGPPSGGRRRTAGRAPRRAPRSRAFVLATSVTTASSGQSVPRSQSLEQIEAGERRRGEHDQVGARRPRPRASGGAVDRPCRPRPRRGPWPDGVQAAIASSPGPRSAGRARSSRRSARSRGMRAASTDYRGPTRPVVRRRDRAQGPAGRLRGATIGPGRPAGFASGHRVAPCTSRGGGRP